MSPQDFTEMVNTVGLFSTVVFIVSAVLVAMLYYAKTKIDAWGDPWVKKQIELTQSLTETTQTHATSAESQAKSLEALVNSFIALEKSTKILASGVSQILEAGDGTSRIKLEGLEFKFRKMKEERDDAQAKLDDLTVDSKPTDEEDDK